MRLLVAALLLSSVLAGCSSKASSDEPPAIDDLGLHATATTGVIRGVVVDAAIRPLANVAIVLPGAGEGKERATASNADGLFGFEAVEPGTHFLRLAKAGYAEVQQSVEVKAGDSAPPIVKVQMTAVPGSAPYVQSFKFNGFLECGLSVVALCSVFNDPLCDAAGVGPCTGNVSNDRFASTVPVEKPPQLVQSEMVWDTTTSASDQLWLWHSRASKEDRGYNGSCNCWVQGKSPLLMVTNETGAADNSYGVRNDVYLRVFTGSIDGTRNPIDPNGCYTTPGAGPVPSVSYCGGVGYSVEQGFAIYTHVFYGYLPPPGWRFSQAPEVPPPS